MSALAVQRVTQLLDVSTLQTAVTGAVANAKDIFLKAVKEAVAGAIQSIGTAINQTMTSVKLELQSQAEKATTVAMSGLKTLKSTLSQIPSKIQVYSYCLYSYGCRRSHQRFTSVLLPCVLQCGLQVRCVHAACVLQGLVGTLCKPMPSADLKTNCTNGAASIVKNVTGVVAEICKAGVTEMMKLANKTCTAAATAAKDLISKASVLCAQLTGPLPTDMRKPAEQACSNATNAAAKIPDEVCEAVLKKTTDAANSVCRCTDVDV